MYTSAPCGQIDACENITFPQLLLRTAKMDVMVTSEDVHIVIATAQESTKRNLAVTVPV